MNLFRCKNLIVLLLLLSSFSIQIAQAADLNSLSALFKKHYWGSFYREGKCGPNSEYFVRLALNKNIDLDGTMIVHVENKGGDTFGMVAAVQAREQGRYISGPTETRNRTYPEREIGEANWYYHAFVVADGYVFDFDFQNNPTIIGFADYIYAMFVPNAKRSNPEFIQNKLGGYYLSLFQVKYIDPSESFSAPTGDILHKPNGTYLLPFMNRTR